MAKTDKELEKLIKQAQAELESSRPLEVIGKRLAKWQAKEDDAEHELAAASKAKKPRKVRVARLKLTRARRKRRFWGRIKHRALYWQSVLDESQRELRKRTKRASTADLEALVQEALKYEGLDEGGTWQRKMAEEMGVPWTWPWCSTFIAWLVKHVLGWSLPEGYPYSGSWMRWAFGRIVSRLRARRGYILVFDWGDGGMTDHVGLYLGGGRHIGGNQADEVNVRPTPWNNVVAVIRPRKIKD